MLKNHKIEFKHIIVCFEKFKIKLTFKDNFNLTSEALLEQCGILYIIFLPEEDNHLVDKLTLKYLDKNLVLKEIPLTGVILDPNPENSIKVNYTLMPDNDDASILGHNNLKQKELSITFLKPVKEIPEIDKIIKTLEDLNKGMRELEK